MRRPSIIIALVAAAAAGAATSSAAILHFTGSAGAEPQPVAKAVRVHAHAAPAAHQKRHAAATPTAAKFARLLAGWSNEYGRQRSAPERIRRVDYAASTYKVTLSGRTARCHTLRDAINSLG